MHANPPPGFFSKQRIEALSDGVFAVVMTLLVLELKLDHLPRHPSNEEFVHEFANIARPLVGYAIAFTLTAVLWLLHHRAFALIAHTSQRHTALTLAFLFPVTLMPFAISVYMQAMSSGPATALYMGNLLLVAALLLAGWLEARRAKLVPPTADPVAVRELTLRIVSMTVGALAASILSYFQPLLAVVGLVVARLIIRVASRNIAPAKAAGN